MHRPRILAVLGTLLLAGATLAQAAGDRGQPVRDPDRGLPEELRARLALVEPARDTWPVERWAAPIEARLAELARRWSEDSLTAEPGWASWIAPELRVAGLFARSGDEELAAGAWRLASGAPAQDPSAEPLTLIAALAAWRAGFQGAARLDCEVFGVTGAAAQLAEPSRLQATVRVQASGSSAIARVQHDATWTTVWRVAAGSLEMIELRLESFDAVTIARAGDPPFVDVTESLCDDPQLYREQLAPGLEHWRRNLSASVSPGALGHHGVALGDVDGDGLEDLYVCRPGGLPNLLFLHTPDHGLRRAPAEAGVDFLDFSSSALLVDLDGDGDRDLAVATGVGLVFLANDGHGRFERKLLRERSLATSLSAADFDADGDLDLYVCSYLSPYEQNGLPLPYHDANNGEANELLRNDGAWSFVDVAKQVGLDENNRRFSFAAAWEDFDEDGDQDLYVANDFGRKNLYRNEGGRFRDVAPELAAEDVSAGMGVDWGDVDHDGWMDLYATNMCTRAGARLTGTQGFRGAQGAQDEAEYRDHAMGNTLLANRGGRAFEDVAESSGTSFGRWGWGAIFVDLDVDGALDLFAPNGFATGERGPDLDGFFWRQVVLQSPASAEGPRESYALGWRAINRLMRQGYSWNGNERNVALWNVGGTRFVDVSAAVGLDHPDDSRAAARIDWDGDGDEDLVVTNRNGPMLRLLENRQATGHAWIAFELASRDPRRTAVGARLVVESSDGRRHLRTLRAGHGYLAQSSARLHVGLGRAGVKGVRVRWPNGATEDFGAPAPRTAYVLLEGSGQPRALAAPARGARAAASPPAPAPPVARSVLTTPLPLPRLALETVDGQPASLLGISMQGPQGTGQPLVLLLWSVDDARSLRTLERFVAARDDLRAAKLEQVLALSVEAGPEARRRAAEAWSACAWPFARGYVGEEALSVLELVLAVLHDDASGLRVPAAFLIEPGGRLVATYEGELEPALLCRDLALVPLSPEARREASVPFPGRWLAPTLPTLEQDVAARLAAHGLDRPASEYELARVEVRRTSNADVEVQIGIARHEQGRLPDAIVHYRRALAIDPAHVLAAQSLAVALHESGDLRGALAAYKQALTLAPAHADTRLNLGYLQLALKDVAGAEAELAALRQLQSENAALLEARIRAAKGE